MTVKQSVLQALESQRGMHCSGEQLAQKLGVSRAAIWKAIGALRSQGYDIEAIPHEGYRLAADSDRLSAEGIRVRLAENARATVPLTVFQTIDSTNRAAKQAALDGAPHGAVLLAEQQSAARGRFGRNFLSQGGSGIYLSMILRPEQLDDPTLCTTAAAVAVCRAVESLTGIVLSIKWVNDLYLNGKKVCGILSEAVTDMESGAIESVVVGIGLNVRPFAALPPELEPIVGSLFTSDEPGILRNQLAAAIITELLALVGQLKKRTFLAEYRARSFLLGRDITYVRMGVSHHARVLDIDDDGGLVVSTDAGETETLRSGEVSVRPIPAP